MGVIEYLKSKGYGAALMDVVRYIAHFVVVMLVLFFGAMVLALIEDPETREPVNYVTCSHNMSDPHTMHNR